MYNTINTKRHFRVKSRFRFTIFVVMMLLISLTGINTILGVADACSLTEVEYMNIEICSGDTLWHIASLYMPDDMDTRHAVYTLCQLNSISSDSIQPGQVIKVPIYN